MVVGLDGLNVALAILSDPERDASRPEALVGGVEIGRYQVMFARWSAKAFAQPLPSGWRDTSIQIELQLGLDGPEYLSTRHHVVLGGLARPLQRRGVQAQHRVAKIHDGLSVSHRDQSPRPGRGRGSGRPLAVVSGREGIRGLTGRDPLHRDGDERLG